MGKTTRKVKNVFKSVFHRPTVHVGKENILLGILLICIVILAFMVRIFPILYSYPILKAFDPYIQYTITQYIVENGYLSLFTWINQQAWYPIGYRMYKFLPGTPYMAATLYHILHFFGVNTTLWETVIIFPAVMGTASTVLMFFLGDVVGNRKTGLLASFLLALSPAYLQRTVAGFFDNETVGIFFIIWVLFFFVRALKNDSLISALISGLGLGALMCSWGAYTYIIDLLPLTALLLILMKKYSRRLLINYSITIGVGIFIGTRFPVNTISIFYDITILIPLGMVGLLFLCEIYQRWKNSQAIMTLQANWRKILGYFLGGIIVLLGLLWLTDTLNAFLKLMEGLPFVGIGGRNLAVLNPLSAAFITQSVGEHLPSPWSVYYYNLHILLIILPIGFFFLFKRLREEDLLIILFGITTLYFSGSFIRLLLILAPSASLISAFGLTSLLKPFSQIFRKKYVLVRRRKRYANLINRQSSVGVFALVGFLLILYSIHGIYTSGYQLSGSAMQPAGLHDWEETWSWMRSSLPPGTVVCSWWDYGYWITKAGNQTSNADNGTINATQIALIGRMFMANDELESIKILKMLGSDYVLVHWGYYTGIGGDEGKWVWMLKIGYENPILNLITYPLIIWDYYNEETGLPNGTFFQSTIWKMLTCGELFFPDTDAYSEIQQNYLYSTFHYRMHTNVDARGKLWKDRFPFDDPANNFKEVGGFDHQAYEIRYNGLDAPIAGLRYFDVAFFSTNHLVKVYKINYELAALQAKINDISLYNNGISTLKLENTGETPFKVTSIKIGNNEITTGNITLLSGPDTDNVSIGDELLIRTVGEPLPVNSTQTIQITIEDLSDPTLTNPHIYASKKVEEPPTYNMTIIPNQTVIYSNETAFITVKNTNSSLIKIDEITFDEIINGTVSDSVTFESGEFTYMNGSSPIVINGNETTKIMINSTYMTAPGKFVNLAPNSLYNITVRAKYENLTRVIQKSVISNTSCLTLLNASAYGNETVFFTVNNTGSTAVTIDKVYLGVPYFNYYTSPSIGDGYVLNRGEIQNFSVKWYPEHEKLNLNASETLFLNITTDETLDIEATNYEFITIAQPPGYAVNITDEAYSNETLYVNVKNIGNYTIEVSDFYTDNIPTTDFIPLNSTNNMLDPGDTTRFRVHTTYNLNYTDEPEVGVRTFEGAESGITVFVNYSGNVNIIDAEADIAGFAIVNVNNTGNSQLIIKDFRIITPTEYIIEPEDFSPNDAAGIILNPSENQTYNLTLPSEIAEATSLRLLINVTTWEGAYNLENLTWNVGIQVENVYVIDNGTIKLNVTNIGRNNVTIYQMKVNQTETYWANITTNMTITPAGAFLEVGQSKIINVTYNNMNFSNYVLLNVSANYTSDESDLVYASPLTENGYLFVLSQTENLTILKDFPYSLVVDNGTFDTKTANDTIKITVMNTGAQNITIDTFDLYNSSSWLGFGFTDLLGVLSNKNYTLEPYDSVTFVNTTINNKNKTSYIELNATNILPIRINTTNNVVDSFNFTIVYNEANITIQPWPLTYADANNEKINATITNYGDSILTLTRIEVNDDAQDTVNETDFVDLPRTLLPGQTRIYMLTPQGGISNGTTYTIEVYTNDPFTNTLRDIIGLE